MHRYTYVSKHGYVCTRCTYVWLWGCGCVYSAAASEYKRLSSSRGSQGGSVSDQALRGSSQQSGEAGHTSVCLETALAPFPGSRVREPLFGNIPVMTGEACLP